MMAGSICSWATSRRRERRIPATFSATTVTGRSPTSRSKPASRSSGFVKGAVWGDYDNDGRLDLYVTLLARPISRTACFHNEGRGPDGTWSFRDVAAEAGVQGPAVSFPTWFFDYDNGRLAGPVP